MIKPKKYARIPTNKRGTTGTVLEKKKILNHKID